MATKTTTTVDPEFTITGIKTFRGREGYGLNATIRRHGKPVAEILDSADGGPLDIHWKSKTCGSHLACIDFARTVYLDRGGDNQYRKDMKALGFKSETTLLDEPDNLLEWWINHVVDRHQTLAQIKRWSKTKTIFRLHGCREDEFSTMSKPFSPAIEAQIHKTHGAKVEWIFDPSLPSLPPTLR